MSQQASNQRYVEAFLDRYPTPRWFTPINEPGITARLSARFGVWNDMAATPEAHAHALANIVQANLEAMALVRADRAGWWIGSEGFDIPVADYFDGVEAAQLARIRSLAQHDHLVAGLDIYPISVMQVGGERPEWTPRELIDLAVAEIERWHDRYDQPFWIAETSNLTLPLDQQLLWLDEFARGLAQLRADGRPARGLCWYSRGDQFDWQTALIEPSGAVTEVGLFDTTRNARPVAAHFNNKAVSGPPSSPSR